MSYFGSTYKHPFLETAHIIGFGVQFFLLGTKTAAKHIEE